MEEEITLTPPSWGPILVTLCVAILRFPASKICSFHLNAESSVFHNSEHKTLICSGFCCELFLSNAEKRRETQRSALIYGQHPPIAQQRLNVADQRPQQQQVVLLSPEMDPEPIEASHTIPALRSLRRSLTAGSLHRPQQWAMRDTSRA